MNCPACGGDMASLTLDAVLDGQVQIDLCRPCQVIWFDRYESLRLTPGSTLQLFRLIGTGSSARPTAPGGRLKCPRCDIRLLETHDRQRNTPFAYWRCPKDHGRLTTFFDFLREKDFIRPLTPQQLAELKKQVQTVNCSNCGGPIDLVHASACTHCGTPISTIDLKQIGEMAAHLQQAETKKPASAPDFDTLFALMRAERDRASAREDPAGVVEVGLQMIAKWLSTGI